MLKEIYDAQVIGDTLHSFRTQLTTRLLFLRCQWIWRLCPKNASACGTATRLSPNTGSSKLLRCRLSDIASVRYRGMVMPEVVLRSLFLSPAKPDMAALRYCRAKGQKTLSIVNVPESTIARESMRALTYAGPEIAASTGLHHSVDRSRKSCCCDGARVRCHRR